jgi:N-acetylmuramoyl-L-alanine amidase
MKLFIDAGHGGDDSGASFNDLEEKTIALEISKRIAERAKLLDYTVKMSRETDLFLDLSTRANLANEFESDLFVSVHLNADRDPDDPDSPEAKGYEFWIYPGSVEGRKLASYIERSMIVAFPKRRPRGIKEANFAVLRETKMPAVLLELAFIDTEESYRLKDEGVQEMIAAAVIAGLFFYSSESLEVV